MDENQQHETDSKQKTPKDEERDIISLYQRGLSVPELSNRYGISDKSIYYMLKKNGVTLRRRSGIGKILSQAQEEDIMTLYQQGIDAVKLASHYEISSTTVYVTVCLRDMALNKR
jgi:Mor family transcriptional regulator